MALGPIVGPNLAAAGRAVRPNLPVPAGVRAIDGMYNQPDAPPGALAQHVARLFDSNYFNSATGRNPNPIGPPPGSTAQAALASGSIPGRGT